MDGDFVRAASGFRVDAKESVEALYSGFGDNGRSILSRSCGGGGGIGTFSAKRKALELTQRNAR